jgi:hypothetical protein
MAVALKDEAELKQAVTALLRQKANAPTEK